MGGQRPKPPIVNKASRSACPTRAKRAYKSRLEFKLNRFLEINLHRGAISARLASGVMQIDKSKFLLLTASIAGSACGSNSSSASGGAIVVAAPIVTLPGAESTAIASPPPTSTTKPGQVATTSGDEETLAGPLDRTPSAGVDDGSMCEEGGVAPTGCGTLRAPGPQCESFSDTKAMCGKLARGLRPRVAEKAVDCILAKSGKQAVCDFNLGNQCALAAMQKGCIEPSTQAACTQIVRSCSGNLPMRDCQMLLSSVTTKNRRNMMACMTEGCSADYCTYNIE
jgi:hypothetical protein